MDHNNPWIQTYSNKKFYLLDPRPDEINIDDIAHALALQCRFTGHTKFHYSVAQHSVYCSQIVPIQFAFEALMHDATEAYIGDMSRAMKHFTLCGNEFRILEARIEEVIATRFELPVKMSPEVKKADNMLLYAEKNQIMGSLQWDVLWGDTTEAANIKIERWSIDRAEQEFLNRFTNLSYDKIVSQIP